MPLKPLDLSHYISMINEYLQHIPVYTLHDFEFVANELEKLQTGNESFVITEKNQKIFEKIISIKELIESPELYVTEPENYIEYQNILKQEINKKIHLFQNYTIEQKNEYLELQAQENHIKQKYEQKTFQIKAPVSGSDAHVITHAQWVQLQHTRFTLEGAIKDFFITNNINLSYNLSTMAIELLQSINNNKNKLRDLINVDIQENQYTSYHIDGHIDSIFDAINTLNSTQFIQRINQSPLIDRWLRASELNLISLLPLDEIYWSKLSNIDFIKQFSHQNIAPLLTNISVSQYDYTNEEEKELKLLTIRNKKAITAAFVFMIIGGLSEQEIKKWPAQIKLELFNESKENLCALCITPCMPISAIANLTKEKRSDFYKNIYSIRDLMKYYNISINEIFTLGIIAAARSIELLEENVISFEELSKLPVEHQNEIIIYHDLFICLKKQNTMPEIFFLLSPEQRKEIYIHRYDIQELLVVGVSFNKLISTEAPIRKTIFQYGKIIKELIVKCKIPYESFITLPSEMLTGISSCSNFFVKWLTPDRLASLVKLKIADDAFELIKSVDPIAYTMRNLNTLIGLIDNGLSFEKFIQSEKTTQEYLLSLVFKKFTYGVIPDSDVLTNISQFFNFIFDRTANKNPTAMKVLLFNYNAIKYLIDKVKLSEEEITMMVITDPDESEIILRHKKKLSNLVEPDFTLLHILALSAENKKRIFEPSDKYLSDRWLQETFQIPLKDILRASPEYVDELLSNPLAAITLINKANVPFLTMMEMKPAIRQKLFQYPDSVLLLTKKHSFIQLKKLSPDDWEIILTNPKSPDTRAILRALDGSELRSLIQCKLEMQLSELYEKRKKVDYQNKPHGFFGKNVGTLEEVRAEKNQTYLQRKIVVIAREQIRLSALLNRVQLIQVNKAEDFPEYANKELNVYEHAQQQLIEIKKTLTDSLKTVAIDNDQIQKSLNNVETLIGKIQKDLIGNLGDNNYVNRFNAHQMIANKIRDFKKDIENIYLNRKDEIYIEIHKKSSVRFG